METSQKPWAANYEEPDISDEPVDPIGPEEPIEKPPDGSILQDIKTMLSNIPFEMKAFDEELILYINSAIFKLSNQGTFWNNKKVTGYDETWDSLFEEAPEVNSIKEFIFIDVKLVFDPPSSSYGINSFKARADELAWRVSCTSEGRNDDDRGISGEF